MIGPAAEAPTQVTRHSLVATQQAQEDERLDELLTRFWVQEEVKTDEKTALTPEEDQCEEHFKSTHRRDASGRYVVRLPLNTDKIKLGDSYKAAYRRLQHTLRRFSTNQEYEALYTEFMKTYEAMGHMSLVPATPLSLSTDGGFKPADTTTGMTLAHDTSVSGGLRVPPVSSAATNHHRTQYYLPHHGVLRPESTSTKLRVVFDGSCATTSGKSLKFGRYVDDIFGGADTTSQLTLIANQLTQLCTAGGFPLAKWHSNSHEVLNTISTAEAMETPLQIGDCTSKILGLYWHSASDNLTFKSKDTQQLPKVISKRTILSEVAQIYDPLGLLAPLTVKSKMLLQQLWLHKLGWDERVPPKALKSWLKLRHEFTQLEEVKVPRWIQTSMATTCELHGFCDASKLATAAVVYVKAISPSGESLITLLCAKTKVTPLSRLTIPKLELSAALLLAKLINYVRATLKMDVHSTTLWTDAEVTLSWIVTHPSHWKDFVRNRVATIQQLTSECSWRHVPGKSNPADCASRGLLIAQLTKHQLWWNGPPWLSKSQEHWPKKPIKLAEPPEEEARPGVTMVMTAHQPGTQWELIYRYSNLRTLMHVTATIFRAVAALKRVPGSSLATPLTPRDVEAAVNYWAKSTQAAYFDRELTLLVTKDGLPSNHIFRRLTAFIDTHGVLRVGGRLENAPLHYNQQHPIILPRHSPLTSLIIYNAHLRTLHGGTQITLAEIRQTYWIIGGRAPVKSFVLRCMRCARQRGKRAQQLMGQLPPSRVTPSRAFHQTGVDYAGPLTIKSWKGRGAKCFKGWICVFVCMNTSAVHIEVVCDYTSDSFIAAYRRFTARRGICHSIYSDCGTTFLGADAALKEMFTHGTKESEVIASLFLNDSTNWHFNPPAAPHMGGKWEAAVKSIKHHLNRTMGETAYTLDEVTTLLTQIEAILNSRPLEPLSDDPDDLSTLTPGHFLIGQALTTLPEPNLQPLNTSRLSRWQLIQQQTQHFWSQWSRAHLQRQLATSKWWHANNEVKVGTLVLLTDERFPPCKWPLARVTQLHPGVDGLTRVVTIKTATTTLVRPLAKLAILPQISDTPQPNHQHAADAGGNVQDCSR